MAKENNQTQLTRERYDRRASLYDLLYWPWEKFVVRGLRSKLWAAVSSGKVIEIGPGTGINFRYHPAGSSVTAVELSPEMLKQAAKRSGESQSNIELITGDVEKLEFQDNSFDSAVATFVFCSVPDQAAGLNELKRVVRPGGKIHFLEHVRIDWPVIGTLMDLWDPVAVRMGGAHINRRASEAVRAAGLIVESEERQGLGSMLRLIQARVPDEH